MPERADWVPQYLERISIPPAEVQPSTPPSLELLGRLQLQHLLTVPFDTSSVHVPEEDWKGSHSIEFTKAGIMKLGDGARDRIIRLRRGGYCFSLNLPFAELLRELGFRVSEMAARVNRELGQDPAEVGENWGPISHACLLVDWPGSKERYFVDVGFGSGQNPHPMVFKDGSTSPTLTKTESHRLTKERLRYSKHLPQLNDVEEGWTLYRRVPRAGLEITDHSKADEVPGFWTPLYHFVLNHVPFSDFVVMNHFNATHPDAAFTRFFLVTQLKPDGSRATLYLSTKELAEKGLADQPDKVAHLKTETGESIDVPFETSAVKKVLVDRFGFLF